MEIISLIDTTSTVDSHLLMAQGVAGLSAYETWLQLGNSGTEQEFIDSLEGAAGVNAAFHLIEFDPISGGGAGVFVADQDSTVITPTIIGSTNNGTSPSYDNGSFAVNYESASVVHVQSGSVTLNASPDVDRVQVVYYHDGSVTPTEYWAGVEAGSLAVGIGAAVVSYSALGDTNVSLTIAASPTSPTTDTLTGGASLTINASGGSITAAALSQALNLSTYPHCEYIITQDPTVGIPANVPDIDYTSALTQTFYETPIPSDAVDGNTLVIINQNGTVLGESVVVGDWCQLYDNKTKIRVNKDMQGMANDINNLQSDVTAINSNLSALDASQVTTGVFNIARIPTAAIERVVVVADQTARFALTTATVQNGDTVKQISPSNQMYAVIDETNLGNSSGYTDYSVGLAASVPFSGITGLPTTLSGYGIAGGTLTSSLNEAAAVTIASSATVNIGAAAGNTINVTGATTITAFDTIADGARRTVIFSGILTLTHNATSLILPTAANITTEAGDVAQFVSKGSGNWKCVGYMRASGASLSGVLANTVNVFTKNQSVTPVALTSGTNIAVDASLSNNFKLSLSHNATLDNPTNLTDGMILTIRVKNTGTFTLAFGSKWKVIGTPIAVTANSRTILCGYYDSTDDVIETNCTKGYP